MELFQLPLLDEVWLLENLLVVVKVVKRKRTWRSQRVPAGLDLISCSVSATTSAHGLYRTQQVKSFEIIKTRPQLGPTERKTVVQLDRSTLHIFD